MSTKKAKYWNLIFGSISLICFFHFGIPFINKILIDNEKSVIEERSIDSGALLYSDSPEAVEGNYFLFKSKEAYDLDQ